MAVPAASQRLEFGCPTIPQKLVDLRNADRLSHYKTDEALQVVFKRNLKQYGSKYGPTYESQLQKYGSDKGVIDAALRSNDSMDVLTGLAVPRGIIMPYDNNRAVGFDPASESFTEVVPSGSVSGNLGIVEGHKVALYKENGQITLQVDSFLTPLSAASTTVAYQHDFKNKLTRFAVDGLGQDDHVELVVPAWWADIPGFVPLEPEMDEDYLGYVYSIWRSREAQKSLLANWV